MKTRTGLLSIAGLLGLVVAAEATSPFDGTYQVISATKVNQTHMNKGGDIGYCQDRTPGPFTIADGVARYTTQSGDTLVAQVAPNGEFEMHYVEADGSGVRSGGHRADRTGERERAVGADGVLDEHQAALLSIGEGARDRVAGRQRDRRGGVGDRRRRMVAAGGIVGAADVVQDPRRARRRQELADRVRAGSDVAAVGALADRQ